MATGDITVFNEFTQDIGEEVHHFIDDTIKLAIIDSSVTPLADAGTPRWHASSDQDFDANEVSDAGGYTADGITVPVLWTRSGATTTLFDDSGDIILLQDVAGFNNGRWGILYNADATNKNAIAFVDLGTADETTGPVRIYWPGDGILTIGAI